MYENYSEGVRTGAMIAIVVVTVVNLFAGNFASAIACGAMSWMAYNSL